MLELQQISKSYPSEAGLVTALIDINLKIHPKEFVAITGSSGSGKSTLLAILGCLDRPTSGQYLFNGEAVDRASDDWLANLRNRKIGFVFQQFNLISRFSALENVELPMMYAGVSPKQRRQRAEIALKIVGLSDRMLHRPAALSGGQQQRVAVARAIVNNPDIILADEPTGSLDDATSHEIMTLFSQLHDAGKTIIFITHANHLLAYASRIIQLEKGRMVQV